MKNFTKALFAGAMALSLAACSSTATSTKASASASTGSAEATSEATGDQTAEYTLVNKTGEKITAIYQYVGTDVTDEAAKGDNLAGTDGLAADASVKSTVVVDASETESYVCTLEFTTESGYTGKFETLHFETVTIDLLSEDAASGATQIAFETE